MEMRKKMKITLVPTPLIVVVDQTSTFPLILNLALRRAACPEFTIAAFQTTELAACWLSGTMDQQKARYPFGSPWDAYPALRPPTIAIVSLHFLPDERDRVMDRLYCQFPKTAIITTSTQEAYLAMDDRWDEVYWRRVVSHLPRPAREADMIERITPLLLCREAGSHGSLLSHI
jgi:hypothetical protein